MCFIAFGVPNILKFPRRASRAGSLHLPKVLLLLLGTKYPKIFAARFARRIASFPYILLLSGHMISRKFARRASRAGLLRFPMFLLLFDHKYPQDFPGALRAPDCFIFLCFYCFLTINTPKFFPARFARRIASFSFVFIAF